MKKMFPLIAVFSSFVVATVGMPEEGRKSGSEIEEKVIREKSFELTAVANRWLKTLDSVALGYMSGPECVRLLYAVDPEYETEPSYALLAEVYPNNILLTILREGKVSTAKSDLAQKQWTRIREVLGADEIWKKADFRELMLAESKSETVWMIEYHHGLENRLFLTERLETNAIHSLDGAVPERKELASLFAEIFGSFSVETIPEAKYFEGLPLQYPSSAIDKPFPEPQPSNQVPATD